MVEDETLLRDLAVEVLSDEGFTVLQAASGPEALAMVEGGAVVDVLFTDVNMPGDPDGLGLADAVCRLRPSTRILVASARPLPQRDLPCEGLFLSKPYRLLDLGRTIQAMLGWTDARRCASGPPSPAAGPGQARFMPSIP